MSSPIAITRRSLLVGSAAVAGGVVFGWRPSDADLMERGGPSTMFDPHLMIDRTGITVFTGRAEMGQGVTTTLAAMIAEELDVALEDVRSVHGPADKSFINYTVGRNYPIVRDAQSVLDDLLGASLLLRTILSASVRTVTDLLSSVSGHQLTGGSTSTADAYDRLWMVGAVARETLKRAAAARWDIEHDALDTEGGYVIAPDDRPPLSYTELAEGAAEVAPPKIRMRRPRSKWRYLGKSLPRLDMKAKVDGCAEFGIDIRRHDMVYAAVRMNPGGGGVKRLLNAEAVKQISDDIEFFPMDDSLGIVAMDTWTAFKAANAIEIEWKGGGTATRHDTDLKVIECALKSTPDSDLSEGRNAESIFYRAGNEEKVEVTYSVPYLAHAAMEPMNAVAWWTDGKLHIWSGNQAATLIRQMAAKTARLDEDQVHVHTPYLGGGFGRRGEFDVTNQAVKLAMTIGIKGKPVKLTWTREQDIQHDFYRPAAVACMKGVIRNGTPVALVADVAAPSVLFQAADRVVSPAVGQLLKLINTIPHLPIRPGKIDRFHMEGLSDQPYEVESYRIRGHIKDVSVPIGFWRSVGYSYNAFFYECFLDELAVLGGVDPIDMRVRLLRDEDHEPSHRTLEKVREMSRWDNAKPDGVGRGMAFSHSFGSPTAQIVEIRERGGKIKIEKVWCAIHVGIALDPDNIKAQVTSGIIYGLSAAVSGEITFESGEVRQSNFHDYDALRMHQAPEICVEVLEGGNAPTGVGEPGTPPSMPALANAVYDLTGERIRDLPLAKPGSTNSIRFV